VFWSAVANDVLFSTYLLFPQLNRFQDFSCVLDRRRHPHPVHVLRLFGDIEAVAYKFRNFGFKWTGKANYNSRELTSFIESLLTRFLDNAPLLDVDEVAVTLDETLRGQGYYRISQTLKRRLQASLQIARLDMTACVDILRPFCNAMAPLPPPPPPQY
jgi:hypothetical protein